MLQVTTVVIGAGHCGLAVSRHLADRGIDHVVLERGEVASSWRCQRWDSLRLLTPNWLSRLPGYAYRGDDPDGYMSAPQVVAFIEGYAKEIAAPVRANTTVTAVRRVDGGYVVETDQETWHARTRRRRRGCGDRRHRARRPPRGAGRDRAPRARRVGAGSARLPQPERPARRRGAGGRAVRQRDPDRPGGARLRAAGDARRRRARADAAHLPGPRRAVVDGRDRPVRRQVRRDPRPAPRPGAALDAAHRLPRARHARPQHAHPRRGPARGTAGGRAGRGGAAVGLAAQRLHARRPQAQAAAQGLRRVGGDGRGRADGGAARRRAGGADRRPHRPPARSSTCAAARSVRSSGPPASAPTSASSPAWATCRCSTARVGSATTAASSPRAPAST